MAYKYEYEYPNGTTIAFESDEMLSREQAMYRADREYEQQYLIPQRLAEEEAKWKKEHSGFLPNFKSSFMQPAVVDPLYGAATLIDEKTDGKWSDAAVDWLENKSAEIAAGIEPGYTPSFTEAKEQGIGGLWDYWKGNVGQFAGSAAGYGANMLTGAGIGALAGTPAGPTGMAIGARGGAMAFPAFTTNLGRMRREQEEAGKEFNYNDAMNAAAASTATELLSVAALRRYIPGAEMLFGKGLSPMQIEKRIAESGMAREIIKGALKTVGVEGTQEVIDTAIERAQSGKEVLSPDAIEDYKKALEVTAVGGAPFGMIGGGYGKVRADATMAQVEEQRKRIEAEFERQRAAKAADAGVTPPPAAPVPLDPVTELRNRRRQAQEAQRQRNEEAGLREAAIQNQAEQERYQQEVDRLLGEQRQQRIQQKMDSDQARREAYDRLPPDQKLARSEALLAQLDGPDWANVSDKDKNQVRNVLRRNIKKAQTELAELEKTRADTRSAFGGPQQPDLDGTFRPQRRPVQQAPYDPRAPEPDLQQQYRDYEINDPYQRRPDQRTKPLPLNRPTIIPSEVLDNLRVTETNARMRNVRRMVENQDAATPEGRQNIQYAIEGLADRINSSSDQKYREYLQNVQNLLRATVQMGENAEIELRRQEGQRAQQQQFEKLQPNQTVDAFMGRQQAQDAAAQRIIDEAPINPADSQGDLFEGVRPELTPTPPEPAPTEQRNRDMFDRDTVRPNLSGLPLPPNEAVGETMDAFEGRQREQDAMAQRIINEAGIDRMDEQWDMFEGVRPKLKEEPAPAEEPSPEMEQVDAFERDILRAQKEMQYGVTEQPKPPPTEPGGPGTPTLESVTEPEAEPETETEAKGKPKKKKKVAKKKVAKKKTATKKKAAPESEVELTEEPEVELTEEQKRIQESRRQQNEELDARRKKRQEAEAERKRQAEEEAKRKAEERRQREAERRAQQPKTREELTEPTGNRRAPKDVRAFKPSRTDKGVIEFNDGRSTWRLLPRLTDAPEWHRAGPKALEAEVDNETFRIQPGKGGYVILRDGRRVQAGPFDTQLEAKQYVADNNIRYKLEERVRNPVRMEGGKPVWSTREEVDKDIDASYQTMIDELQPEIDEREAFIAANKDKNTKTAQKAVATAERAIAKLQKQIDAIKKQRRDIRANRKQRRDALAPTVAAPPFRLVDAVNLVRDTIKAADAVELYQQEGLVAMSDEAIADMYRRQAEETKRLREQFGYTDAERNTIPGYLTDLQTVEGWTQVESPEQAAKAGPRREMQNRKRAITNRLKAIEKELRPIKSSRKKTDVATKKELKEEADELLKEKDEIEAKLEKDTYDSSKYESRYETIFRQKTYSVVQPANTSKNWTAYVDGKKIDGPFETKREAQAAASMEMHADRARNRSPGVVQQRLNNQRQIADSYTAFLIDQRKWTRDPKNRKAWSDWGLDVLEQILSEYVSLPRDQRFGENKITFDAFTRQWLEDNRKSELMQRAPGPKLMENSAAVAQIMRSAWATAERWGETGQAWVKRSAKEEAELSDVEIGEVIDPDEDAKKFLLRLSDANIDGFESGQALIDSLMKQFGAPMRAALASGRVVIHDTDLSTTLSDSQKSYLMREIADGNHPVGGFVAEGPGKLPVVHLIAGNIDKNFGFRTLMHEAGVHAGLEAIFGEAKLKEMYAQVDRALASIERKGGQNLTPFEKAVAAADAMVKAGNYKKEHVAEERLAYLSEADSKLPFVRFMLAGAKNFIRRVMPFLDLGDMSLDEFRYVAQAAARKWMLGKAKNERDLRTNIYFAKHGPTTPAGEAVMDYNEKFGNVVGISPEGHARQLQQAMKRGVTRSRKEWADWFKDNVIDPFATYAFSSSARARNLLMREYERLGLDEHVKLAKMLDASDAQILHDGAMGMQMLQQGMLRYNEDIQKFEAEDSEYNFADMMDIVKQMATDLGLPFEEIEMAAHTYAVGRRLDALRKQRDKLIAKMEALPDTKQSAGPKKALEERIAKIDRVIHWEDDKIDDALTGRELHPRMEEVFEVWDGVRKNVLDFSVSTGILNDEEADILIMNQGYVPFSRLQDQDVGSAGGWQAYLRSRIMGKEQIQHFKNGGGEVSNVFRSMENMIMATVSAGLRNHKAGKILEQLNMADNADATELLDPMEKNITRAEQIARKKALEDAQKAKQVVVVLKNGKETYYKVGDKLLMETFKGLDSILPGSSLLLSKSFNMANAVMRQPVVLNPLFTLAQLPQDAIGAMFMAGLSMKQSIKLPYLVLREFVNNLRKQSPLHEKLKRRGVVGVPDWTIDATRQEIEAHLSSMRKETMWEKVKHPLQVWAMYGDNAIRQAVYHATMLDMAGDPNADAVATERAFEIINFRRRGASPMVGGLIRMIPFFGAALQAHNVQLKVLAGRGIVAGLDGSKARRLLLQKMGMATILYAFYTLLQQGRDDYEDMDDYERDRMIYLGGGLGIPLRHDISLIPKLIAEHGMNLAGGMAFADWENTKSAIWDALYNIGTSPSVVPQLINPSVGVFFNRNMFSGRDIVPQHFENLNAEDQYTEQTSEISKELGGMLGLSPMKLDYWLRGTFSSLAGMAMWTTDRAVESAWGKRPTPNTQDTIRSIPGMGRFLVKKYGSGNVDMFYELAKEVDKAVDTYNRRKKTDIEGVLDWVQEDEGRNAKLMGVQKGVEEIRKSLAEIRAAKTQISFLPAHMMSQEEKERVIEQLNTAQEKMLRALPIKKIREISGM